jgi:hypothetical protein
MMIKLLKLLKNKFILATIPITIFSCTIPEKNCSKFKVGEFNFVAKTNTGVYNSKSIRNDSIEIEYFGNTIDTSKITWVSECEYILRKLKPKNISDQKAVSVKIISSSENSYVFEYSFVGDKENRARGNAYRTD